MSHALLRGITPHAATVTGADPPRSRHWSRPTSFLGFIGFFAGYLGAYLAVGS